MLVKFEESHQFPKPLTNIIRPIVFLLQQRLTLLFFIFSLTSSDLFALDFAAIKGISQVVRLREGYEYLAPDVGFTLGNQGTLNQSVRHGDSTHPPDALVQHL